MSDMRYSTIDGSVVGTIHAVNLVKGQPVDLAQTVGREVVVQTDGEISTRIVTVRDALGTLADQFTVDPPAPIAAHQDDDDIAADADGPSEE